VTVTGGCKSRLINFMERGWFPRIVLPAGGLRAARVLGFLELVKCMNDEFELNLK
jgi:hypothetical protein